MVAAAVQYIYNHQVDIHQYAKKKKKSQLWLQLWFSKYITTRWIFLSLQIVEMFLF